MKAFKEFVRKEIYHISRDYRTLFVLLGMPIAQLIIFGFAIRTEISEADIGIFDKSKDHVTQKIIDKIVSSGHFKLTEYIESPEDMEKSFRAGKVKQIIVFEENFAHKLGRGSAQVQIINDASDPNVAKILNMYASTIILDFLKGFNQNGMAGNIVIAPQPRMMYNPEMRSVYMFVPGLIVLILMLVSALMTSVAITKEKEKGTLEVLLVSPLRPQTIIIGKVIPYLLLSLFNAATVLVLSRAIFGVPFKGSMLDFAIVTVIFILVALGIGIVISTISKTQQTALMISLAGLLMPTVLLSGFIFPIENMPWALQLFSKVIPATWYLIILKAIMLKGLSFGYFWQETLVLIGFMIFLLTVANKKFKVRLE